MQLNFSINGEFITEFAREKLYEMDDFDGAIQTLMNCLITDQLTETERYELALSILDGVKYLSGICSVNSSFIIKDEITPKHLLANYFAGKTVEIKNNKLLYKYLKKNIFSSALRVDDLMGFIEPDGTFHQVDWCQHDNWAKKYLKTYYNDPVYNASDFLVYKLHWILLDCPLNGIPQPTYDEGYGLTKKQKETLFDFYMFTNQKEEAKKLFE